MPRDETITEPAPCPRCGGTSTVTWFAEYPDWPRRPGQCGGCQDAPARARGEFERRYRERFGIDDVRLFHTLRRHFVDRGDFAALLRATDEDLLLVSMMGPKSVAKFRALLPEPEPRVAPSPSPPCLHPHGPLSWAGG